MAFGEALDKKIPENVGVRFSSLAVWVLVADAEVRVMFNPACSGVSVSLLQEMTEVALDNTLVVLTHGCTGVTV